MTNARKHHLDEEFIVAKLIEDDRSKSEFGSWSFHNESHCVDILTGDVIRHDIQERWRSGKGKGPLCCCKQTEETQTEEINLL